MPGSERHFACCKSVHRAGQANIYISESTQKLILDLLLTRAQLAREACRHCSTELQRTHPGTAGPVFDAKRSGRA